MSKKEKRNLIKALLSEGVQVKNINEKIRLNDLFSKGNNAVVIIRHKKGILLFIGL